MWYKNQARGVSVTFLMYIPIFGSLNIKGVEGIITQKFGGATDARVMNGPGEKTAGG